MTQSSLNNMGFIITKLEAEDARILEESQPHFAFEYRYLIFDLFLAYHHFLQQVGPVDQLYDQIIEQEFHKN